MHVPYCLHRVTCCSPVLDFLLKLRKEMQAITSQAGVYLRVDELIEIAKLLGLNSQGDVSAVEAVVAGDLQLAFDPCLSLAKKGHGPIWDLCVVMARGPE